MLQSNFFCKNFRSALFEYIYRPWLFHFYYITICKEYVDLINERQNKTQGFLGKISESHEINLSWGQGVLPENYSYLNPTELLDLCRYVVQFIPLDCGSVVVV